MCMQVMGGPAPCQLANRNVVTSFHTLQGLSADIYTAPQPACKPVAGPVIDMYVHVQLKALGSHMGMLPSMGCATVLALLQRRHSK